MFEKSNIEVTLLSKEEIEGKSEVLQKLGRQFGESCWTRTDVHVSNNGIDYNSPGVHALYIYSYPELRCAKAKFEIGVRPVLKSDNLDEVIRNLKITYENGVEIVEYGQYYDTRTSIDIPDNKSLKPTGKKYYEPFINGKNYFERFDLTEYLEYEYNGQKVIGIPATYHGIAGYYVEYIDGVEIRKSICYHPVKPIKFYVDRENNMLIAKDILFKSPINVDSKEYWGCFEDSQLYQFLNNQFIKALTFANETDIIDVEIQEHYKKIQQLIQRKKELLERKKTLNLETENRISDEKNKGRQKTYHL